MDGRVSENAEIKLRLAILQSKRLPYRRCCYTDIKNLTLLFC
jgi:hypothetical protein